ncbi:MAG: hypothetical protein F6K26_25585 [Moorea sp. SIO2I5]|nr:hypothetical protein [Moorena sp. SIO2I5]
MSRLTWHSAFAKRRPKATSLFLNQKARNSTLARHQYFPLLTTPDSRLPTPDSRLPTPDSRHPTPNTRLPTPNTQHPTPNTQHPTPDTRPPTP